MLFCPAENIANIMKKLVFVFLFIQISFSQSIFWEIRNSEGKNVGYIFGTMHSNKPEVRELVKKAVKYLEKSEVLFVELAPEETSQAKALKLLKHMIVSDTSLTLPKVLGEKKYSKMKKKIQKKYDFNIELFKNYQPILINSMLLQKEFSQGESSVADMFITEKAQEKNIPVKGLETAEEQLKALVSLPYEKQAELLYESVRKRNRKSSVKKLVKYYLEGDINKMFEFSSDWEVPEEYKKVLIEDRNFNMTKQILRELEQGKKVFVAVGALHLPGENGIIRLLEKQNYKITPVSLNK